MATFRNPGKSDEFFRLKCFLQLIFVDAQNYAINRGMSPIVTSIFRTKKQQQNICKKLGKKYRPSVHEYGRGIDFIFSGVPLKVYKKVCDYINKKYPYPKKRLKTAVLHGNKKKGYGMHIHLQVGADVR